MDPIREQLQTTLFVAGVNYKTAPVEVRERMAVAHTDRIEVSRLLQLKAGLAEVVVVWTCNRVEIYGVGSRPELVEVGPLFQCMGREAPDLMEHVFCLRGEAALRHLFRVTSGLESMVMGETQISGQIRDAYDAALKAGLTGGILNPAFQTALRAAKAVRTHTAIGRGARSVGGVAVACASEALGTGSLDEHTVLLVGAGEMASCCLKHLQKKGNCSVVVANRSMEKAKALAQEFSGRAVALDERYEAMKTADVVISSTGSPDTVIDRAGLEPVMAARGGRPLVLIDIAVPRDIDPDAAELPGVHLHDIDAMQSTVDDTLGRWEKDLERCNEIIGQEIEELFKGLERRRAAAAARQFNAA